MHLPCVSVLRAVTAAVSHATLTCTQLALLRGWEELLILNVVFLYFLVPVTCGFQAVRLIAGCPTYAAICSEL